MTDARVIVNESNGDLFVTYLRGEPSAYTYPLYKKSTDGGATWSVESKRLYNESGDDFKQIKTNFMSNATFFAVWYNDDIDDIYGYVVNSTLSAGNYFVNETLIDDLIISSSFFDQNSPSPGMVFINETHGYASYTENRVGGLLVFGMINGLQEIPQERESILLLPTRQGASISPINSWIRVMILSLLQRRFGRLH